LRNKIIDQKMPKRKKLSGDEGSDDGKRRRKMDLVLVLINLFIN
jgi:hypothetical protein